jgi:hypothetical protein
MGSMDNTAEIMPDIEDSAPVPAPFKLTKGHILNICRENGLSIPEVTKTLGMNSDYAYHITKKLSKQDDLTSKVFVKLASKAVKAMIQGKTIGEVDTIKDSTVLQAAKMVYDRVQPVVTDHGAGAGGVTFIQVNLDVYK